MKKWNNAGLSLVELIVTILIMSILTAGVTVGVAAMHRADAEKEASKIANVLEKGRVQSLSRAEECYVRLYADDDGKYISFVQGSVENIVSLDEKTVIAYKLNTEEETELTTETEVRICFSKSSGAFKMAPGGYFVEYIKVTANEDLYVCLVEDTGRCYIDTTY